MEIGQHIDALRRDGPALLDAARAADPERHLESCPDWTPVDLVWHVGGVWDFFGSSVRHHGQPYTARDRPDDAAVLQFAEDALASTLDVLSTTDPSTHPGDVRWIARRLAHETVVHRVDADRAAGRDVELDADVASDGIDEYLTVFVPGSLAHGVPVLPGSLHVHCTDVAGEWIVEPSDGRYEIRRDHEKGDAAMRGSAQDLFLVLWRRLPLETVDVVGDRAVAEALTSVSI